MHVYRPMCTVGGQERKNLPSLFGHSLYVSVLDMMASRWYTIMIVLTVVVRFTHGCLH